MYRTLVHIVGAVCLVGGALAELIWSFVWPGVEGGPAKPAVAAIVADPSGAHAGLGLDLLVLLLIPAALFAGRAIGSRTRPLAGVGTALLFAGSLAFVIPLAGDAVLVAAAGTDGVATAQAYFDSAFVNAATLVGLAGQLIGSVVLGIAALRSRMIPVWAAVLLIVWNLVNIAGTFAGIALVGSLGDLLLLAAYAACAVRLFRPAAPRETARATVAAAEPAH